jgi:pimeloyl-ACP methyl ester carboxylesterase
MFAVAVLLRPLGCLAMAAALLAGCSAPPSADVSAEAPELSAWGPCPPGDAPADGVECATISVPYDYDRPDGETFTIPVARIPSRSDHPQLLMMNPGGPGISGVGDLRGGREYYEKFTEVYTVVSFDPRGMGGSEPAVSCLDDQQRAAIFDQPSVPLSEADSQRRQDLAAGIGAACERDFGSALSHLGTENVVRDMDAIRGAMGFDKTSYLGYSYGTFVGALYAQTFPERTGRVVLDSVMAPELDYRAVRHGQAKGMQRSVIAFAEDCLRRDGCPLPGPANNAVQTIADIIAGLDKTPYRDTDGRVLSGSRMLALVESSQ